MVPPVGTMDESGTWSRRGRDRPACSGGRRSVSSRLWKLPMTEDSPVELRGRHGSFGEETYKWFMGASFEWRTRWGMF